MKLLALLCSLVAAGDPTVVVYPAPADEELSRDYTVAVEGRDVAVYLASTLRGGPASFGYFDFDGPVNVTVTATRDVTSAQVLPESLGIRPSVTGNVVSFTLNRPANLTIELNDSYEQPLHLFGNPLEVDAPREGDRDVKFYGPGVHNISRWQIGNGQTIYLAGGAVLRAFVPAEEKPTEERNWAGNKVYAPLLETFQAHDIQVRGRGILDLSRLPWHARTALWIGSSQNVLVEGIIIRDAPAWVVAMHNSRNVTVRNVKQICARENSDGVDICNSQDVLVEDCFLRNNDDAVCVKTITPAPDLVGKNILVERCVVWNERARGLGITSETRRDISQVVFRDCDIIHDFSAGGDCAALAILVSDSGAMRDIRFENIRCADVRDTLINCWIGADTWSQESQRGHIQGVVFKHIDVTGATLPRSKLSGFDDDHLIQDVTFQRLRLQGQPAGDAAAARLETNAHVREVRFVPGE